MIKRVVKAHLVGKKLAEIANNLMGIPWAVRVKPLEMDYVQILVLFDEREVDEITF